ncbi:MAG TPA: sugar transferase [Myxococcota bacterium]|nr:sugar transferase [Myxococcota bacterium]
MLRNHSESLHSTMVAIDVAVSGIVLMMLLSFPFAAGAEAWQLTPSLLTCALVACLAWPVAAEQFGLYRSQRRSPFDDLIWRLVLAGMCSTGALAAAVYLLGTPLGPRFAAMFGAAQFSLLTFERVIVLSALRVARRFGRNTRNVLIVGSGARAADAKRRIELQRHWGLRVVGFLDDADVPISPEIDPARVRKLVDVRGILRDEVIDEVIVAVPRSLFEQIMPVVAACGEAGVPFTVLSDFFGDHLPPPQVARFGPLTALRFARVHHPQASLAIKRGIDLVLGSALLVATLPVIAVAALAIRATSPGSVFFLQTRSGLFGRRFRMIKLRTMVDDAEARRESLAHLNAMTGPVFKIHDDPRVTPVGRWLRRFSIDELPQLWNVVRGEMSLVGPRPALPAEVVDYSTFERRRLSMRPGLTCLWQVGGRNLVSDFEDWVRLDLEYIDTWSLGLDARILLRTIPAVMFGTGY